MLAAACSSASGSAGSASSATSTTLPNGRPVASGSVTAVSGSSMSVESSFSGTTAVQLTSSTTFSQTVSATAQDLTVGSCIDVTGTPPASGSAAGPIVARSVTVSGARSPCPPAGGAGLGGGRSGSGGRGFGGGAGGGLGGGGGFGGTGFSLASASGKVTAVSGSSLTLAGTGRIVGSSGTSSVGSTSQPTQVEISASSSTVYSEVEAASQAAVVVGRCVTVLGSRTASGALTASSVSVRPPGTNGCGGFGARGAGAGFGGGNTA
ncbi:MAG TPA: DUF5666 domain-containing protein [Acidimicrobiales bacterium]|nr:DUF5666 domain-containing protein [Acidimicrobiales bacterium]